MQAYLHIMELVNTPMDPIRLSGCGSILRLRGHPLAARLLNPSHPIVLVHS